MKGLRKTEINEFPVHLRGKVRDVYDLGDELLIIVTDRVSAFDVVFDEIIPLKGKVLTQISNFWFDLTKDIVKNHIVLTNVDDYPKELQKYREQLDGRSIIVKKIKMVDAECIVRGYIEGSGLKEYNETGEICGIKLPDGLKQADKLPEPIFTPSTKADQGHDENVSFEFFCEKIGDEVGNKLKDISLLLYKRASEYALSKGIILADTKFEFGIIDGEIILADEIFTPDSSRFWALDEYEPGRPQKSFDKQFLREFLENTDWNKKYPAPKLPQDVIEKTTLKYIEAYNKLTGKAI